MAYFRGCIVAATLHKMYRLPQSELNKRAALTLSTTDIAGMERGVLLFHEVWAGILSTGVGIYILSRLVDAASFLVIIPVASTFYNGFPQSLIKSLTGTSYAVHLIYSS